MSVSRTQQIRQWLLKAPRPDAVRVAAADGEAHDFAVPTTVRWATLAASVDALDPVTITALDKNGGIVRAIKTADWEPPKPKGDDAPQQQPLPEYLHDDPETARLALFARLLADSHKFATGVAFDKLSDIVSMLGERQARAEARADKAEDRYRREMYEQIDDMLEDARAKADEGGGAEDIISTFASAVAAGRRGEAPNGAPSNGAPKKRRRANK